MDNNNGFYEVKEDEINAAKTMDSDIKEYRKKKTASELNEINGYYARRAAMNADIDRAMFDEKRANATSDTMKKSNADLLFYDELKFYKSVDEWQDKVKNRACYFGTSYMDRKEVYTEGKNQFYDTELHGMYTGTNIYGNRELKGKLKKDFERLKGRSVSARLKKIGKMNEISLKMNKLHNRIDDLNETIAGNTGILGSMGDDAETVKTNKKIMELNIKLIKYRLEYQQEFIKAYGKKDATEEERLVQAKAEYKRAKREIYAHYEQLAGEKKYLKATREENRSFSKFNELANARSFKPVKAIDNSPDSNPRSFVDLKESDQKLDNDLMLGGNLFKDYMLFFCNLSREDYENNLWVNKDGRKVKLSNLDMGIKLTEELNKLPQNVLDKLKELFAAFQYDDKDESGHELMSEKNIKNVVEKLVELFLATAGFEKKIYGGFNGFRYVDCTREERREAIRLRKIIFAWIHTNDTLTNLFFSEMATTTNGVHELSRLYYVHGAPDNHVDTPKQWLCSNKEELEMYENAIPAPHDKRLKRSMATYVAYNADDGYLSDATKGFAEFDYDRYVDDYVYDRYKRYRKDIGYESRDEWYRLFWWEKRKYNQRFVGKYLGDTIEEQKTEEKKKEQFVEQPIDVDEDVIAKDDKKPEMSEEDRKKEEAERKAVRDELDIINNALRKLGKDPKMLDDARRKKCDGELYNRFGIEVFKDYDSFKKWTPDIVLATEAVEMFAKIMFDLDSKTLQETIEDAKEVEEDDVNHIIKKEEEYILEQVPDEGYAFKQRPGETREENREDIAENKEETEERKEEKTEEKKEEKAEEKKEEKTEERKEEKAEEKKEEKVEEKKEEIEEKKEEAKESANITKACSMKDANVEQKIFQSDVGNNTCWAFGTSNVLKSVGVQIEPDQLRQMSYLKCIDMCKDKKLPEPMKQGIEKVALRIDSERPVSISEIDYTIKDLLSKTGYTMYNTNINQSGKVLDEDKDKKVDYDEIKTIFSEEVALALCKGSAVALRLPGQKHYITIVGMRKAENGELILRYKNSLYNDQNDPNMVFEKPVQSYIDDYRNCVEGNGAQSKMEDLQKQLNDNQKDIEKYIKEIEELDKQAEDMKTKKADRMQQRRIAIEIQRKKISLDKSSSSVRRLNDDLIKLSENLAEQQIHIYWACKKGEQLPVNVQRVDMTDLKN